MTDQHDRAGEGCERFDEAIALYAAGEPTGADREELLTHLGGCARCSAELDETRALVAELAEDSPRLSPERERSFAERAAGELRAVQATRTRRRQRLLPAAVATFALAAALVVALRPAPPQIALFPGAGGAGPVAAPPELDETALAAALPEAALLDPLAQLDPQDWDGLARAFDDDPGATVDLDFGAPDLDDLSDEELSRLLALLPGS